MIKIAEIVPGTIADELRLEIGSRVVRINGAVVRDAIDFRFLEAECCVEVEVVAEDGEHVIYEIEKEPGERLGILAAPDTVRQCANRCVFCFIDGNPSGARTSLHVKDDDFRLSFTYGSYVTLTNLGPKAFQRLIDQRLSPLYVSVHATEPEVRTRLLGVPRGGEIVLELQRLLEAGIEVHTQVVLCPDWNDRAHLDRTIDDLWNLGPGVLSLSVVPVGLTRYNLNRPVRLLSATEACVAIGQVERARERARELRGTGWIYAGDELFFIAGEELPPSAYYDDWPLVENGVGAVRAFLEAFDQGLDALLPMPGLRIAVVTGTRMVPLIAALVARINAHTGACAAVVAVENAYFGPTVNTAGLLAGRDIGRALPDARKWDVVLVPAEALNDDARFIDDVPLADLESRLGQARVLTGHELTETLGRL